MTNQIVAATGVALFTLFMVIALATVGMNSQAPTGQIAQQATVQSAG